MAYVRAGLLCGLLLGGCAPAPPRLVVFALVDAARGDRMSYAGYERETTPFLDSLAESESLVALQHFSQGPATRSALPRLFYSRYFIPALFPASASVPIQGPQGLFTRLDDQAISLPEVFAGRGFRTVGVSAHTWLRSGTELVALFDEFHDLSSGQSAAYREAPAVVDTALSALAQAKSGDVFLYLHFMDTHWPYRFGSRARTFYGQRDPPAGWPASPKWTEPLTQQQKDYLDALYDGSLRRVDDELRRLLRELELSERWSEVALVVTSDHGEHLGEVPGRSTHGGRWFDAVAHIPLLVSAPGMLDHGSVRFEAPTESVDLLPTLIELFDLAVPEHAEFDGSSLLDGVTDGIALAPDAIRVDTEKVVGVEPDSALWKQTQPPEFFLLDSDPLELRDRSAESPDRVGELIAIHQRLLSPSYHRFRNARSSAPPELPFAVASRDFSVHDRVGGGKTGSGWNQERDWVRYNLSCVQMPCDEIGFEFPMPDGEYLVNVAHFGAAELFVEGGEEEWVQLPAPPVATEEALRRPWQHSPVSTAYGPVRVTGQVFRARLRNVEDTGFVVRHLGFIPRGSEIDADQEAYEARLRALGYLQ